MSRKIVVAVTGASGAIYAKRLLLKLSSLQNQISACSVVFSGTAKQIWTAELGETISVSDWFNVYDKTNFKAPFASGSAKYDTMIIIPASMGTLGRIASGVSNDLVTRAADVMLKERRRLILVPRETPYSLIHLRNMTTLTEAGAIICPASPSFYHNPQTIEELVDTVVDRVLDLAGFDFPAKRWQE